MHPFQHHHHELAWFTNQLNLALPAPRGYANKQRKLEQVVAFIEIIQSEVRQYSRRRPLIFADCGAGNCQLSLTTAFYFAKINPRPVEIHCVDHNAKLMTKNREVAAALGLDDMHFHACDIGDLSLGGPVDLVMALHACDTATDKAIHLGVEGDARHILTVACCQRSLVRSIRGNVLPPAITRHRLLKERFAYMIGDAMRALLLEMHGYEVDIIEFVSSRATDKNTLVRARRRNLPPHPEHAEMLATLAASFGTTPALAHYFGSGKPRRTAH